MDIKDKTLKISREVTIRFFEVLDKLIELNIINSKNTIAIELKQSTGNFYTIISSETRVVQLYMCEYIVSKYGVDGNWLITGQGKMFREDNISLSINNDDITNNKRVTEHFFKVTDTLEALNEITSNSKLFLEMGYTKTTYPTIRNNDNRYITLYAMHYLVTKFKVDANWVLSGIGKMML